MFMPRDHDQYHTHHRSRRLPDHHYASPAAYFITICAYDRACLFGTIENGQMCLNTWGQVVAEEWTRTETLRDEVHLDAFVVMPNRPKGDS